MSEVSRHTERVNPPPAEKLVSISHLSQFPALIDKNYVYS